MPTSIIGPAKCSAAQAAAWAHSRGADRWFADLTETFWEEAWLVGVRADVAFALSCKETNFGRFGGVIDASYNNFGGIKNRAGGGNYDPHAHHRFATQRLGIRAVVHHLHLYAKGPLDPTPDPRHFPAIAGHAPTVEKLSGKWAPSPTYHETIVAYIEEMVSMAPRYGIWKPLPEAASQPKIRPTQMIVHSIVGSANGAYGYFKNSTSTESHFIMTWGGEVWQLMESNRQADANYKANRWPNGTGALSMETEDDGRPDSQPWSNSQVNRIIDWFRWGNRTFGIPLSLPAGPADPGIGYHTLFPNHWTNVSGKTCPGIVRKEQFYDVILPALTNQTAQLPEEEDMPQALAFFRPTAGSNANNHCYRVAGNVASWCPTREAIDTCLFLGMPWWGGSQDKAWLDPNVWTSLAVMNGPLANVAKD